MDVTLLAWISCYSNVGLVATILAALVSGLLAAQVTFFVFCLFAFGVYVYGWRPFYSLKHIPGPPRKWLWGNVTEVYELGAHDYQLKYAQIYGPIYSSWCFQGPEVVLASPELIRKALVSSNNRPVLPAVSGSQKPFQHTKLMDDFAEAHIMTASGDLWRSLRDAFDPFFLPGSLEAFAEVMNKSSKLLVKRLGEAADTGELVNIHRLFCDLAMEVIIQASFGVELNIQNPEEAKGPFADRVRHIHKDAEQTFHGANATEWFKWCAAFPEFLPIIKILGTYFPDEGIITHKQAMRRIITTVQDLVHEHRAAQHLAVGSDSASDLVETELDAAAPRAGGLKARQNGLDGRSSGLSSRGSGIPANPSSVSQRPSDLVSKLGKRRGVKPGSFLDLLARTIDRRTGQPLSDGTIIRQGHAMIMAGFETTAITMSSSVYNLSRDPASQEKIAAESLSQPENPTLDSVEQMPFVDAVIRESLRMYPSAAVGGRCADRDMVLGGYKIKKGTHLKSSFYAIQRDPKLWKDPTAFKPGRWLQDSPDYAGQSLKDGWYAFGGGARGCPGQRLAMEEAKIALLHVYREFTFTLGPGQVPLKLRHNLTMSPAEGVWVTVQRRT